jgi:hypothetical protein
LVEARKATDASAGCGNASLLNHIRVSTASGLRFVIIVGVRFFIGSGMRVHE